MDLTSIPALLASHAWIPLAAVLVGFLVWMLKTRPALEDKIPPRLRPWLALALGQLLAVLQAISVGTPWKDAVLNGMLASLTAMLGHDVGIEGLRGGRELGAKAATSKPLVTISGAMLALRAIALTSLLCGCSWFSAHEPQVIHGAADVAICVLEHDSEPIGQIAADCYGVTEADVVAILGAHKSAMMKEAPTAYPLPSGSSPPPALPAPSSSACPTTKTAYR